MPSITPEEYEKTLAELRSQLEQARSALRQKSRKLTATEKRLADRDEKLSTLRKDLKNAESLARSTQKRLDQEVRNVAELSKLLGEHEQKNQSLTTSLEQVTAARDALIEQALMHAKLLAGVCPTIQSLGQWTAEQALDDGLINKKLISDMKEAIDQLLGSLSQAKGIYQAMKSGNESQRPKKQGKAPKVTAEDAKNIVQKSTEDFNKETKKAVNTLLRSCLQNEKSGIVVRSALQQAAESLKDDARTSELSKTIIEACTEMLDEQSSSEEFSKSVCTSKGRQIVDRSHLEQNTQEAPTELPEVCPACGRSGCVSAHDPGKVRTIVDGLEMMSKSASTIAVSVMMASCKACGATWPLFNKNVRMALNPKCELAVETVVGAAYMTTRGIAVNNVEEMIAGDCKLGNSTLHDNINRWSGEYLAPLYNAVLKKAQSQTVSEFDESPYPILQEEGRGHMKATGGAESEEKTDSDSVSEYSKKTYIEVMSSVEGGDFPFAIYMPLHDRSRESIAGVLNCFKPEFVVTDGYQVYDNLVETAFVNAKRQSCLIHLRRHILEAADLMNQSKMIQKSKPKDVIEYYASGIKSGDPLICLDTVITLLSLIYREENKLKRQEGETREAHLQRVYKSRQSKAKRYMDTIDLIMRTLAQSIAVQDKKGNWRADPEKPKTLYAGAVVYYMNQRESLRTFLDHPEVPPDSNNVERSVRVIGALRRNSFYFQSMESAQAVCRYFSLIETAIKNGIERPWEWLISYTRAFSQHCQVQQWLDHTCYDRLEKNGNKEKDPYRDFVSYDTEKYSKTFDVTPWLPDVYKEDDE